MTGVAPVVRLALGFALGSAVGVTGAPWWMAPLAVALGLALPIWPWRRPDPVVWTGAAIAGWIAVAAVSDPSCEVRDVTGPARLEGIFLAGPRSGSAPFQRHDGCGTVTVVVPDSLIDRIDAGHPVMVRGRWRPGAWRPWVSATTVSAAGPVAPWAALHGRIVERRDALVIRAHELFGDRGPLVAALVFARREGLDPGLRDRFALGGIAHLLAISGFHVGVIGGLALAVFRIVGFAPRSAGLAAAGASWIYVAFIGLPAAACRAALILGAVAVARARGRPPTRWGALGLAGLLLLLADPTSVAGAGFQLSFAGAAGLVAWSASLRRRWEARLPSTTPRGFLGPLATGVAATLATLPIVAWHFDRVSLVGIPLTLVASPLVSLALPGALLALVLDTIRLPMAHFLAGGVTALLDALVFLTDMATSRSWVALWVTRPTVIAALTGIAAAWWISRRPGIRGATRRRLTLAYGVTAVVAWPVAASLQGRGTLEVVMIDVGQGDAVAIRTPGSRWVLVDAGPPLRGTRPWTSAASSDRRHRIGVEPDAEAHPVVRALRARGVHRLETLVLTHPDADHFGGAVPVLRSLEVGRVLDPLVPAPKAGYAALLREAVEAGVPWVSARTHRRWSLDGVDFRVLHPPARRPPAELGGEANAASVVLHVAWRSFDLLLTGDAYVDVERRIMHASGDVDALKVGHHGSRTSTDSLFLATVRPELALISVGRGNRYGHPAPEVLARLEQAGVEVVRTDRQGEVRLLIDRAGRVDVRTAR